MSFSPTAVEASYRFCHRMARRARSSFAASFFLLPRAKRRAMDALYAFMRHTDDLGDSALAPEVRAEALRRWRSALGSALAQERPTGGESLTGGDAGPGLLLPALADSVQRFSIPPQYLHEAIDGQEMDLQPACYQTFSDLVGYCEKVASAVGLACLYVWGFRSTEALEPARKCGIAFQLTNILRDLKEDLGRGRIYLPVEDLDRCGYRREDLLAGVVDQRFESLVALEVGRARRLYEEAAEVGRWLDPDGRRIFGMMSDTYRRLLEKIERRTGQLLQRRVGLGRWEKLAIALRWILLPPRQTVPE